MSVSIIRVTADTAACLERVAEDVFDGPIRRDFLSAFLADSRHALFVAIVEGQVVGQASGVEYLHPDKPPQFFFNEVGVSPDWQRRGVGRLLSEALIAEAGARGCDSIWLATDMENAPAHRCFDTVDGASAPQACYIYAWDFED